MKQLILIFLIIATTTLSYSQKQKTGIQTFTGNYKSVADVMDPLSCYTSNGGYLTYGNNQIVKISFDEMKVTTIKSGHITVSGYFDTVTHESNPMDPCPRGTENIFIVEAFKKFDTSDKLPINIADEWIGNWATNYGDLYITINGSKVTGTYSKGTLSGTLERFKTGSKILGTWQQTDSDGWFYFYKKSKEKIFSGNWGYSGNKTLAEEKWNGHKK